MKILVIGASGLVGGNCLAHFGRQPGWDAVGTYYSYAARNTVFYDTLNPANPDNFDAAGYRPDVVVHCGALTHVDYCEQHPEESHRQTVQSTRNVVDLCQKTGARLAFISTDYVFDGLSGPYSETDTVNPLSVYGRHKLEAENMAREAPGSIVVRVTNLYGDEERGKNFVARIVSQIREGKKLTLKLPGDQYATPINALDIARCLGQLIRDGRSGLYHLSGTDYMSRVQLALRILKHYPGASYELEVLTTENMGQPAARPLQGGLKNHRFMEIYPDFRFSTVDDYLTEGKLKEAGMGMG